MIALDTGRTVDVWLESDAEKPEGERPTFVIRFVTAREWGHVGRLLASAHVEQDNEKGIATLLEALHILLVDWRNLPGAFDIERLPDLATFSELWELVYAALRAQTPGDEDRKNSASRSGSNTEPSAQPAPVASDA